MKKIAKLNLIVAILMLPVSVLAAMSSTNYYIYADSVESGGGLSSGGAYSIEDTMGEGFVSKSIGSAYKINAGYQAMVLGTLSMNISNGTISLGDLSTFTVSSASTTVTVTTDAENGYSMSIQSISWADLTLADVADGTVTVGQEEYGVAVSGPDIPLAFTDDRSVVAGRVLANKTSEAVGSQTVITFKASISSDTSSGDRSQAVGIAVSANL